MMVLKAIPPLPQNAQQEVKSLQQVNYCELGCNLSIKLTACQL